MDTYEQKYKEALERAKDWATEREQLICPREIVESIFPELRESEDEKIRKELISHFEAIKLVNNQDMFHGFKIDNILAWFEKQKEQKPVEIHIDNPNVQKFDPDVKVTTSDSSASGKELLYVSNKSYNIGYRDGVNSVKPAEWSEEDEEIMETMIRDGNLKPSECAWLRFQVKERLKSSRPSWKPGEEQKL